MKQRSFFKTNDFPIEFGGELLKGRRKSKRPLSTKRPIHNVLRANLKTSQSFLKNRPVIIKIITKYAARFSIKIYRQGLARDHIHLVTKFERREDYSNFVRALSGELAKLLKFKWLYRPYSKVLGCEFTLSVLVPMLFKMSLKVLGLFLTKNEVLAKEHQDY